ncbi:uncharacterized protein LOC107261705 [Ricinus communis]|uniref:uncharacterized protein LOC107261705 n=1 Tax=Ricinus communis TaxID=3988 RepID=UPI00201B018C|nr:uncharacterized protein LOC107261705 [Ricinus communis]
MELFTQTQMVRQWKEAFTIEGGSTSAGGLGKVCLVLWLALVTLSLLSAIIFSCAEGVSNKDDDKSPEVDATLYGGGCAAGCGAACGG